MWTLKAPWAYLNFLFNYRLFQCQVRKLHVITNLQIILSSFYSSYRYNVLLWIEYYIVMRRLMRHWISFKAEKYDLKQCQNMFPFNCQGKNKIDIFDVGHSLFGLFFRMQEILSYLCQKFNPNFIIKITV